MVGTLARTLIAAVVIVLTKFILDFFVLGRPVIDFVLALLAGFGTLFLLGKMDKNRKEEKARISAKK